MPNIHPSPLKFDIRFWSSGPAHAARSPLRSRSRFDSSGHPTRPRWSWHFLWGSGAFLCPTSHQTTSLRHARKWGARTPPALRLGKRNVAFSSASATNLLGVHVHEQERETPGLVTICLCPAGWRRTHSSPPRLAGGPGLRSRGLAHGYAPRDGFVRFQTRSMTRGEAGSAGAPDVPRSPLGSGAPTWARETCLRPRDPAPPVRPQAGQQ